MSDRSACSGALQIKKLDLRITMSPAVSNVPLSFLSCVVGTQEERTECETCSH